MDAKPFYAMIVPMADMAHAPPLGAAPVVLDSPIPPVLPPDFETTTDGTVWILMKTEQGPRWGRVSPPKPPPT